jgi:hypothetical protein
VSPLALLVAAAFWTMLWGVPGLLLAVPLTVCLFVAGKYMNQLRFFSVILGEEPSLEHYQRLYQRLLAQDAHEVRQIIIQCVADTSQTQCLDQTVIPVLQLTQHDLARGVLEAPVHHRMLALLDKTFRELAAKSEVRPSEALDRSEPRVLCVAAGDDTDVLVAALLASALKSCDIAATVVSATEVGQIVKAPAFVWICALPPTSVVQANQLCKQLRRRFAQATIGVGLWNADRTFHKSMERMRMAGAQRIATSLSRAVQMTVHAMQNPESSAPAPSDLRGGFDALPSQQASIRR